MSKHILDDISIDVERAKQCASRLKSTDIGRVARVFSAHVNDISGLLDLPLVLVGYGEAQRQNLVYFVEALFSTKNVGKYGKDDAATSEVHAEVRRLVEQSVGKEDAVRALAIEIDKVVARLPHVLKESSFSRPMKSLMRAASQHAWTALEFALRDAWIAVLNNNPAPIGQRAIAQLPEKAEGEDISRKQISLALLARNGFNVRSKLGDLLVEKYGFTSISGIRSAYSVIFEDRELLKGLFSDRKVVALEQARHLIVHRAGIVDQEYKRKTKCRTAVGKELPLNGKWVSLHTNAAIGLVTEVLSKVDEQLT
jgi:hypothetical protein